MKRPKKSLLKTQLPRCLHQSPLSMIRILVFTVTFFLFALWVRQVKTRVNVVNRCKPGDPRECGVDYDAMLKDGDMIKVLQNIEDESDTEVPDRKSSTPKRKPAVAKQQHVKCLNKYKWTGK